jgi:hypothetical protein
MKTITLGDGTKVEISDESYANFEKAVKPEFKVGDWVCYVDKPNYVYRATGVDGVWVYGLHGNDTNGHRPEHLRLATPEEIKEHLIKEAEKRGYKEGVRIQSISFPGDIYQLTSCSLSCCNETVSCGGVVICRDGKWAEIIKEETILTLDGVDYSKSTLRSMIKKATS